MTRKRVIALTAALLLVAVAAFEFWRFGNSAKESSYVTMPVQRNNITQVVSSTGTLQAVVTVQVGSQVSGTIDKLFADFNTKVKAGQVVVQLNQDKFKASVDQGRANVLAAQSSLAKAKGSVARIPLFAFRSLLAGGPADGPSRPGASCFESNRGGSRQYHYSIPRGGHCHLAQCGRRADSGRLTTGADFVYHCKRPVKDGSAYQR